MQPLGMQGSERKDCNMSVEQDLSSYQHQQPGELRNSPHAPVLQPASMQWPLWHPGHSQEPHDPARPTQRTYGLLQLRLQED